MIKAIEIDHEYKVPPRSRPTSATRRRRRHAVHYGTPHIYALAAKLTEDRIPGTSPGLAAPPLPTGQRYPYIFPIAADVLSQGGSGHGFRQEAARRNAEEQEDRLPLLRQPGRP
jgi:branched-chain amino acid transport system substrate-binding protein